MAKLNQNGSQGIAAQIAALKRLEGRSVDAGWFSSNKYPATGKDDIEMPVARVARINEFGATITTEKATIIIPARPFMRGAWVKFHRNRKALQSAIAKKLVYGKIDVEQALGQIGSQLENDIADSMRDGGWQDNADSTIAKKKGMNTPLFDTKIMFKTLTHKVN